jgi:hypothetical protein
MPNAGALNPASTSLQPVEEDEAMTLPGGHSALQINTQNAICHNNWSATEQQTASKQSIKRISNERQERLTKTDHFGEAMFGWKRPGVQAKQRSERDTFAKEPAGHGAQRDEAAAATA